MRSPGSAGTKQSVHNSRTQPGTRINTSDQVCVFWGQRPKQSRSSDQSRLPAGLGPCSTPGHKTVVPRCIIKNTAGKYDNGLQKIVINGWREKRRVGCLTILSFKWFISLYPSLLCNFFHLLEQEITINAVFEINLDRACAGELAHDQFHEVEGPPDQHQDLKFTFYIAESATIHNCTLQILQNIIVLRWILKSFPLFKCRLFMSHS